MSKLSSQCLVAEHWTARGAPCTIAICPRCTAQGVPPREYRPHFGGERELTDAVDSERMMAVRNEVGVRPTRMMAVNVFHLAVVELTVDQEISLQRSLVAHAGETRKTFTLRCTVL